MKRIIIAGGTGHIGSYLIRNLHIFLPDIKIYILDNFYQQIKGRIKMTM